MAANPVIGLRSNRAHTETMVLGQLKKSQQNRATAFGSCQITGIFCFCFDGPAEFTESAQRACGSTPIRSHQPEYLD
jgi:hypothetical protein